MMGKKWLPAMAVAALAVVNSAGAVPCFEIDECMSEGLCVDGACVGVPRTGGTCDDGNECTVNDTCVSGVCQGTAAPNGAACNGGCGSCVGAGGFTVCVPDFQRNGQNCNDGFLCTTGDRCQFGVCLGDFRICPDADGNPCTLDFCNPQTGACMATSFSPCTSCQTCVRATSGPLPFRCDPSGNGTSCDDFNVCTGDGICNGGECLGAPPVGPGDPTPTASATHTVVRTPTSPPGNTPTPGSGGCPGDCNGDGAVTVDEVISGVNIALGNVPVSACPAMDDNGDSDVTVDEILKAVNAALNGCP